MATYRIHKTANQMAMSSYHLMDRELSYKAKGLLSVMLTFQDDWSPSIEKLSSMSTDGSVAVKSAIDELAEAGYVVVTKVYPHDGSNRITYVYDVYEIPLPMIDADSKEQVVCKHDRRMSGRRASAEGGDRKHVYLFECGGRYKIGVSKDVPSRIKQLDNRPFPVNVIAKSPLVDDAFDIESSLHSEFDMSRVYGEWFDLSEEQVRSISEYLCGLTCR